ARHPEFEVARWAAEHLGPGERARATVYSSREHCARCRAARAWVGLSRIHFAASRAPCADRVPDVGAAPSPQASLSLREVAPRVSVAGPVPELAEEMRDIHRDFRRSRQG